MNVNHRSSRGTKDHRKAAGQEEGVCHSIPLSTRRSKGPTGSGGCPKGGDRFAEDIAAAYGCKIKIYPANWNKYGKRAGFERNTYIARDADVLIACVAPDRTGGTEDTIRKFQKLHPGGKLILV